MASVGKSYYPSYLFPRKSCALKRESELDENSETFYFKWERGWFVLMLWFDN